MKILENISVISLARILTRISSCDWESGGQLGFVTPSIKKSSSDSKLEHLTPLYEYKLFIHFTAL